MKQTAAAMLISVLISGGCLAQNSAPSFDVASVRPCAAGPDTPGGPGKGSMGTNAGRLHVRCMSALSLVRFAYVTFADPTARTIFAPDPLSGGPSWIKSAEFDIEAKAAGTPTASAMEGPMLKKLLEDRFKLKIRRETREINVYNLATVKSGFKLRPLPEGSCDRPAPFAKQCGLFGAAPNNSPQLISVDLWGMTLDQMCAWLSRRTDRPIVNQTGIQGLFTAHVEFANNHGAAPDAEPDAFAAGPSFFTALQEQLGLRLEPARSQGAFLVIESIEKPEPD